jgi:hypothetical protein
MSLIQASHNILDVMLRLDVKTYLRCPTVTTVRALYAIREIYLVWKSTQYQNSQFSHLITEEVLALTFYVKRTNGFLERAKGVEGFSVPDMALNSLASITKEVLNSATTTSHLRAVFRTSPVDRTHEASEPPANDLEAILTLATTPSEASTSIVPAIYDTNSTVSDHPLDTNSAIYHQVGEHNDFNREGEHMALSDFDVMIMPDADWVFGTEF